MRLLLIDADYNFNKMNQPVIRLYGKIVSGENEGQDIVLHVLGFSPYIYVGCPPLMDIFQLQKMVEKEGKGYIKRCEIVKRFLPISYQIEKSNMLRLILFSPKTVPELRKLLKERIPEITDSQLYEADIPFNNRFLIDAGISGMDVIEFTGEKIPNYGLGIKNDNIYICKMSDIKVLKDDIVKIEY